MSKRAKEFLAEIPDAKKAKRDDEPETPKNQDSNIILPPELWVKF